MLQLLVHLLAHVHMPRSGTWERAQERPWLLPLAVHCLCLSSHFADKETKALRTCGVFLELEPRSLNHVPGGISPEPGVGAPAPLHLFRPSWHVSPYPVAPGSASPPRSNTYHAEEKDTLATPASSNWAAPRGPPRPAGPEGASILKALEMRHLSAPLTASCEPPTTAFALSP